MKKLILLCALAVSLAACTKPHEDSSSCSMITEDNEGFVEANKTKELVCIDSEWYVKLDKNTVYSFQNDKVTSVDMSPRD